MSCFGSNGSCDNSFARLINRFVGETVTIFTTSGGASGCGFTGVVLSVNCNFVRLVTHMGTAPENPLAENICGDFDEDDNIPGSSFNLNQNDNHGHGCKHKDHDHDFRVGSVCDIPIDRIAAFCHNAV